MTNFTKNSPIVLRKITNMVIALLMFTHINSYAQDSPAIQKAFSPDWWSIHRENDNLYFYGRGESSNRDLAEELARSSAYQELVFFVNAWTDALLKSADSWTEINNVSTLNAFSDQYVNIVGTASISGSQFTRRETYELPSGIFETYFRLSITADALKRIMENAVI